LEVKILQAFAMYTDASEGYGYGVVPELIPEVVPHEKYDCKFLNVSELKVIIKR